CQVDDSSANVLF
nr:immunoglobulin light chain junction region [Macaca mulatta]